MSTFVLFGVVYDATTGLEVDRLPARPEYTGRFRKPDLGLLARLNGEAELLASRKERIERLENGATPFDATAFPPMVHPAVDEDETPWDREAQRLIRTGRAFLRRHSLEHFTAQAQERALNVLEIREREAMFDMPSVDPEDTRSPEPYDVSYETTPNSAFVPDVKKHVALMAFVYAALSAGLWATAIRGLRVASVPQYRVDAKKRRTHMVDADLVPLYFGEEDGPHVTEDERAWDLDVMEWLHRADREVERGNRRRQEDASGEVARIGIPGVAAPLNRALFDYERLLSNRDAPMRLAVVDGRKRWLVQDRAFPGEQNIMLALEQRLAAGEKHVPDARKWSAANRSRFNVRRYIDAVASAFADDPNASFAEVDAIKQALLQRGAAKRAATWAEVEAWAASQWRTFAERCFLDCVGEEVSDGSWMTPEHSEVHGDGDDEVALSYEDLHGMHGVHVDRGHAVYQVDLVSTTPPALVGGSRTPYVSEPRPTHVRPARPSERGWFTMDEVVKGLLSTVKRMDPLPSEDYPTTSGREQWGHAVWPILSGKTPTFGTTPDCRMPKASVLPLRRVIARRLLHTWTSPTERWTPALSPNSRAQVRLAWELDEAWQVDAELHA